MNKSAPLSGLKILVVEDRFLVALTGDASGMIFAAGVGVGFLPVPVMTTGGAFDLARAMNWRPA
ncbi:hypothetical protein MPLB_2410103 [Mesorhizobium sp. ORS 3324]|nr:hypothetical protein MPLB_2410103 [Mesorhizobium sp. ORS 3324]